MLILMPQGQDHIKPTVALRPSLRRFFGKALDVVLPAQCLGCSTIVETPDTICAACWAKLAMIGPAACRNCGLPFAYDQDAPLCGECIRLTPPFSRARSAVAYDDASRRMIMVFKHGDRPEAARLFAKWMKTCASDLLADADVLVPVPLDAKRLFKRKYNQAALIATELSSLCEVPTLLDAVERIRPTPGQGQLSAAQRRRNVAGAFSVPKHRRYQVSGKRVLLVDDVYTTGATAWSVSRELNRAGAASVDVLTVARVVR